MCLKEPCFSDCSKVSLVVPVFKNLGVMYNAKNDHPVSLSDVVKRFLKNFQIISLLITQRYVAFSHFQQSFRSSQSTVDLLTVVSDRIDRDFNSSGAPQARALDISNGFDRVWHAGILHKLKSYGISIQIFGLFFSFFSNRWLRVVLDAKHSQEYPVNAGVPQDSILAPTLFVLYMDYLTDYVICIISLLIILLSTQVLSHI